MTPELLQCHLRRPVDGGCRVKTRSPRGEKRGTSGHEPLATKPAGRTADVIRLCAFHETIACPTILRNGMSENGLRW